MSDIKGEAPRYDLPVILRQAQAISLLKHVHMPPHPPFIVKVLKNKTE